MSDKIFHTDQLFFYSEKVGPGRKASAPHFHSAINEVVHVTKGELYAHEGNNPILIKSRIQIQ